MKRTKRTKTRLKSLHLQTWSGSTTGKKKKKRKKKLKRKNTTKAKESETL